MSRVQELISVLSKSDVIERTTIAKVRQCCKICGRPAKLFSTPQSKFEYEVSVICQPCQDYYYGGDLKKTGA